MSLKGNVCFSECSIFSTSSALSRSIFVGVWWWYSLLTWLLAKLNGSTDSWCLNIHRLGKAEGKDSYLKWMWALVDLLLLYLKLKRMNTYDEKNSMQKKNNGVRHTQDKLPAEVSIRDVVTLRETFACWFVGFSGIVSRELLISLVVLFSSASSFTHRKKLN